MNCSTRRPFWCEEEENEQGETCFDQWREKKHKDEYRESVKDRVLVPIKVTDKLRHGKSEAPNL